MKKFLLALFLSLCCVVSYAADVLKFQTTELSIKTLDNGSWSKWSDWEKCSCLVVINLDKDVITIFSSEKQTYDITDCNDPYTDSDGDEVIKMHAVDQDGDECDIRLILRKSGAAQLYVDFADIMWVYNIVAK